MKSIKGIHGSARPSDYIIGPTGCWVHYNVVQSTDDDDHDVWIYDGIWFNVGEYENVERGILPVGEVWTAETHLIFRAAQHRRTDDLYMIANRMVRDTDSDDWRDYRRALDAWNESVSAMADGYSTNVPKLPEAP